MNDKTACSGLKMTLPSAACRLHWIKGLSVQSQVRLCPGHARKLPLAIHFAERVVGKAVKSHDMRTLLGAFEDSYLLALDHRFTDVAMSGQFHGFGTRRFHLRKRDELLCHGRHHLVITHRLAVLNVFEVGGNDRAESLLKGCHIHFQEGVFNLHVVSVDRLAEILRVRR